MLVDRTVFSTIISNHYNSWFKIPFRYKNYGISYTGMKDGVLLSPDEYALFFINNFDVKNSDNCKMIYKFFVPDCYKCDPIFIKTICNYKQRKSKI